ncbi:VCBS repeat-containing protein [Brevibacterium ravenspurgense]|uniref:VCBS repeat-containing protein n=1 Tax=Brevibacterium ravenspurgense TaxID=479117 RepID=UPI0002DE9423|nr:VCBS repeat-containing protein [Brevibacterium ravenspurgense]
MKTQVTAWPRRAAASAVSVLLAATALAIGQAGPAAAAPADDVLTWTGATGAATGSAVSQSSCDFTGDGKHDIVTSAWIWDRLGTSSVGVGYVIPGDAKQGQLDDPTTGVIRIEGPSEENALVGFSVNCAGDVNDDGIDDIILTQFTKSRAYVVFGSREPEHIQLDHLGDRGFIIASKQDDRTGYFATGVGDIDGDGKDDVAVISLTRNNRAGAATVVSGSDDIATVEIPDSKRIIATIEGVPDQGLSTIAPAGDVNGDGKPDLVLGGYVARPAGYEGRAHGMAWVVFGDVKGEVKLGEDFEGFAVNGPERGWDRLGISVASAGDVDNDGKDDLIIGADGVPTGASGKRNGAVAIVRGADSKQTVTTDPEATDGKSVEADGKDRGWWIDGGEDAGSFGFAVSALPPQKKGSSGTLVIGDYSANRAWALDTRALNAPRISVGDVSDECISVLKGEAKAERLGRSVGVVAGMNGRDGHQFVAGGDAIGGIGTVRVADLPAQGPTDDEPPAVPDPEEEPTDDTTPTFDPDDGTQPPAAPGDDSDTDTGAPEGSEPEGGTGSSGDAPDNGAGTSAGSSAEAGEAAGAEAQQHGGNNSPLPRTGAQFAGALAAGAALITVGITAIMLFRRRAK